MHNSIYMGSVSDKRMRKAIVKSIEALLLPEYRKFCKSFLDVLGNGGYCVYFI